MNKDLITVTSPLLPDLDDFNQMLREIWDSKWITNNGSFHQRLEQALCEYLKVPYISLFTNGTLPLITALQALNISGEVITTPYSFVATTHSLWWNGIKPVFVDIDPATGGIDPDRIEAAITPRTTAIMPVHVYGKPCRTSEIQAIADKYGLRVIYDAAHAFGIEVDGKSILTEGDMSTLSFHATKVYNTIEGGALVMHDEKMKQRIDYLKNFGFNGRYRKALRPVEGITFWDDMPGVRHNYSYFPIFVDADKYGMTRDDLFNKLRSQGILARRYFYPLISDFSTYRGLPSAARENLPNATRMADTVICLPMHHQLTDDDLDRILSHIIK